MNKSQYKLIFQFLVVFSILALVPFLYFYTQFNQLDTKTQQYVEQLNRNKLEYSKAELQTSLTEVSTSLQYLSNNGMLDKVLQQPNQENIQALQDFWLLIVRTQGYFSHLRFIDAQGMEVVRVNSSQNDDEIVPLQQLQFKGDRSFFKYAQTLTNDEVGEFGIDLESEYGEITTPFTPAYRVIYPLSSNGKRTGYFIANLDLTRIYRGLAYKRNSDYLPNIVNKDGYYIMSPNNQGIMGHLIAANEQANIALQYPKLWQMINERDSGTFRSSQNWISFTTAMFDDIENIDKLTFFITTDFSQAQAFTDLESRDLYIQATFIFIILFLLSFTFVAWNHNHIKNSLDSKIARAAMNGMSAVVITDRNNRIIQVNSEFTRVSGYTLNDVKGKPPSVFASGKHQQQFYMNMWKVLEEQGLWEGEVVNKRRDGSLITEILRIQTVKDRRGTIQFYVASFVDISHRKELEDRLRELSEKDSMTSLWNRRKFDSEMQVQVSRIKRYRKHETSTLALIDIDHFKRINDKHGHDKGDEVIKEVALSLKHHLRETDLVARIGGEEFAIIMPHTELNEAEMVLNRIRIAINLESELNITISVGLTEISASAQETYKRADIALYESKSLGRNQVSVFSASEADTIA
ncbi:sensor domain-containing diguanylate cyclase [Vibrio pacinii]|uniref:sensor domain-containing diguanylate cyclase n=1 Tax=Vibrio pacinii TaxID=170674 RepID=UPI000571055F|nr:diguanylate cyclase [Vibrio pacinii]